MKSPSVPSLPGHPVLGHLPDMVRDPAAFLARLGHTCGDLSAYRLGPRTFSLLNAPDLIHDLLLDRTFERTNLSRKLLRSFLGDGLLSQEGGRHLAQRRLVQPAFHRARLAGYAEVMVQEAGAQAAAWRDGEVRDVQADLHQLTFRVVSRTLFSDAGDAARRVAAALARVQAAVDRQYEGYAVLPAWLPVVQRPADARAIRDLREVVARLVRERRGSGEDRGDLLSMLLLAHEEDGTRLTDEDVAAQALTLLFAGHETTANTLGWAFFLLGGAPGVRERLHAELAAVLGDRPPTLADLPRLPYTGAVIEETLRLYPPAWFAERTPTRDVVLGEHPLRAGMPVVYSTYVTQRDGRFFEDADAFVPERFLPPRRDRLPKHAYFPFGGGTHVCVGQGFALMEARLLLATLAARFDLRPVGPERPPVRAAVTLGLRELPVRLHARTSTSQA